jgi:hypothetical protein
VWDAPEFGGVWECAGGGCDEEGKETGMRMQYESEALGVIEKGGFRVPPL